MYTYSLRLSQRNFLTSLKILFKFYRLKILLENPKFKSLNFMKFTSKRLTISMKFCTCNLFITGTPTKPGIVPRALHHIFKELEPNIGSSPCIKLINIEPNVLTDESVRNEVQIKDLLIKRSEFTEDSQNMQTTIENECYFERTEYENEDCCYYIWVSFAEIYNENVYDLLSPDWLDDSNKENFQKKNRNLRIISNEGNAYIKNLTSIFVTNKEEAYKILQIGLTRVSNAATKINMKSTRSHCIFFVDIIKYTYTLTECTLSSYGYKFCDLAGSERANKTENEGTRFVESKNINKSLLTLGRCLSVAYERQQNKKKELVIPFRESKLTTLLQCALQGKEKITLFVNLSPISEYIDENMNVLNFSAIAKEIHTTSQPIKRGNGKRISRYSFFMASKIASPRRGISSTDLVVHELQREIGELRQQNSMLRKEMILQEMKVRKELCAAWDNDHSRLELSNTRTIENLKLRHESEIKALKEEIMELKNYIDELEGEVEIVE